MTTTPSGPEERSTGSVLGGFMMCIGLNILHAFVVFLIALSLQNNMDRFVMTLMIGWGGIGLVQFLYVIPIHFHLKKKEKLEKAKGLTIAASLVLLVNATCWGVTTFRS